MRFHSLGTSILKKELNYFRKENWWKKERHNLILSERSDSCFGDNIDHLEHVFIFFFIHWPALVQLLSRVRLCRPMDRSMPGLPVHQQLPEFTQTHVHWVGDTIQPYHLLSSPSPPAFNLSQHQGLFKWVSSSHQVAKVLEFQLQHQSFHEHPGLISFRMDWLDFLVVQDAQGSSPTPQFKRINSSLLSFHYSPTSPSIHDYWKTHSFH